MATRRISDTGEPPHDPVGLAVARFISELLGRAAVTLHYTPMGGTAPEPPSGADRGLLASASREVLDGWCTTLTIRLGYRVAGLVGSRVPSGPDPLMALPAAALQAADRFRGFADSPMGSLGPAVHRALRDTVVVELLAAQPNAPSAAGDPCALIANTLEYLIELSGSRVESKNLTHGVVISDVFPDEPRLSVPYPSGLRAAKRSPLLFDGQRSVLVVDRAGRARTEVQRHRLDRFQAEGDDRHLTERALVDRGPLVAIATSMLGGIGFYLREDRSIWTFVDGRPLVIRRGEHWTAFPLWLPKALGSAIGGGHAVELVVQVAMMISVLPSGAILGIVDGTGSLHGVVAEKDRFDLRNRFDPDAMRPETRLHHLIDVDDLDAQTLSRLASLDGATIVDRDGRLLAYGAIVTSGDSQHEGARTAAARSLSNHALAVLKVSEDGEITIFQDGDVVATLLRSGADGVVG